MAGGCASIGLRRINGLASFGGFLSRSVGERKRKGARLPAPPCAAETALNYEVAVVQTCAGFVVSVMTPAGPSFHAYQLPVCEYTQ
jgi:hypothetical protein